MLEILSSNSFDATTSSNGSVRSSYDTQAKGKGGNGISGFKPFPEHLKTVKMHLVPLVLR